jgi:hypothetical protein
VVRVGRMTHPQKKSECERRQPRHDLVVARTYEKGAATRGR